MHTVRKDRFADAYLPIGFVTVLIAAALLPGCNNGDGGPDGECVAEICGDGIDNDCDGSMDCWDYDCGFEGSVEMSCFDGIDNDCDGATDAWDPDCSTVPAEICGDGFDNDGDGAADCWDTDCGYQGPAEYSCADGLDNDCDGSLDCRDPDCTASGECVTCETEGRVLCGEECVDTASDPRHCGGCSQACAYGQVCQLSACQDVADCRLTPCTGFSYCNLADGKCMPGCASNDLCLSGETCDLTTHLCACQGGLHRCSGLCVDGASPAHCGTSCTPCPGIVSGTATCSGGACGVACSSGFHICSGVCVSNMDLATCGTRCEPCPTQPSATATCDGVQCRLQCTGGTFYCTDTARCEGCCQDGDCGPGMICEPESPGGLRSCRPGCHTHAQCGEDQFCTPELACAPIDGSGWCLKDDDCNREQACDPATLRCFDASSYSYCDANYYGCGYGGACVMVDYASDGHCVQRGDGAYCVPGAIKCGEDLGCSPLNYKCYSASPCNGSTFQCGPAMKCNLDWNGTSYYYTCNSAIGDTCYGYETDCKGARCVVDTCLAYGVACADASGCFFVYDDILECVESECRQVFGLRCAASADCDPEGSSYVHCVTAIGRCAMGPG